MKPGTVMTSRTLAAALAAGVFSIAILGGTVSADPQKKPTTASGASSPTARAGVDDEPWPRTITSGDTTVTIYQPQIDAFDGFTTKATAAVSVARTGRDAQVFGVVSVTGRTLIDKVARLVTFDNMQVTSVSFPSAPPEAAAYEALIRRTVADRTKVFSLDRLEASLGSAFVPPRRERQRDEAAGWSRESAHGLEADTGTVCGMVAGGVP